MDSLENSVSDNHSQTIDKKVAIKHPVLEPIITFNVSLLQDSIIPKESFDTAREYLKDEIGLDVKFDYVDYKTAVKTRTDHLTMFSLIELSAEEYYDRNKPFIQKIHKKGLKYGYILFRLFSLDLSDSIKRCEIEERRINDRRIHAVADNKKGVAYIEDFGKHSGEFLKQNLIKGYSMLLLHEFGHLYGLWHTDLYKNDGLGDFQDGLPNIMSDNNAFQDDKYGVALSDFQKAQMRDYFLKGESYQMLKNCRFDFGKYLESLVDKKGYIWAF